MAQVLRSTDWQVDIMLANPPFGRGHLLPQPAASSVGELAYLELSMAILKPRGRCAVVVPDGILFRDEGPFRRARERLLTEFAVVGVVRLPVGTFASAPTIRTNVLIFERDSEQPDVIRYYQVQSTGSPPTRPPLESDALAGAVAWLCHGKPDRYSWEVRAQDVRCGDWSLDIPWPGTEGDNQAPAGQLHLLPDKPNAPNNQATVQLGAWIEKRGMTAGSQTVERFLGVSKHGFAPFKGKPASDTRRYRRVETGDLAYNPMRAALGAIALCQSPHEAGWVSPAYVVFRPKDGAPFSGTNLLRFLRSPAGMIETDRHSHGSVRRRLRYKDLGQMAVPVQLYDSV